MGRSVGMSHWRTVLLPSPVHCFTLCGLFCECFSFSSLLCNEQVKQSPSSSLKRRYLIVRLPIGKHVQPYSLSKQARVGVSGEIERESEGKRRECLLSFFLVPAPYPINHALIRCSNTRISKLQINCLSTEERGISHTSLPLMASVGLCAQCCT